MRRAWPSRGRGAGTGSAPGSALVLGDHPRLDAGPGRGPTCRALTDLAHDREVASVPRPQTEALARGRTEPESAWTAPPVGERALSSRIVWGFLFLIPLATLITAAVLTPNPVGHGTHTQLGLPPCGFYVMTGVPCPGCGLTTCFSYMMHLDPVNAAYANPFGVMLFLVSATAVPVSFVGMIRGLPVVRTLDRLHLEKWAILLAVSSLTVWVVRIVTMLS